MQTVAKNETSIKNILVALVEWLKYFFSKWIIISCVAVAGGLLGLLIFKTTDAKFAAETTFVLEEGEKSNPLIATLGIGGEGAGLFSNVDNIIWLYQSRNMLKRVLLTSVEINGKKDLIVNFFLKESDILSDYPDYQLIKFGVNSSNNSIEHNAIINMCVRKINSKYLELNTVKKTENGVSVKFEAKNPEFAKKVNDVLVNMVSNYYITSKIGRLQGEINNLESKIAAVRKELNNNIYDVASTVENTPYANPTLQTYTVPTKRKSIDVQVNTATYVQLTQSLETLKIELTKSTPLINIIDSPELPLPKVGLSLVMHIVLGIFIGLFGAILVLFSKRYYKLIMSETE